MELAKFNMVEARYNKAQKLSFFLLGTLVLTTGLSLLTVFVNKKLGVEFRMQPLALIVFVVFEYFLSTIVFATKIKGIIDFDDDILNIHGKKNNQASIPYSEIKKINLNKGKKSHFLSGSKTPKIYTVDLFLHNGTTIRIKIENQVVQQQSLLPARIHELSEKWKIPLER